MKDTHVDPHYSSVSSFLSKTHTLKETNFESSPLCAHACTHNNKSQCDQPHCRDNNRTIRRMNVGLKDSTTFVLTHPTIDVLNEEEPREDGTVELSEDEV